MEVGDFCEVLLAVNREPTKKNMTRLKRTVRISSENTRKKTGYKFVLRKMPESVYIWRIE